jgi:hypothetical protein
MSKFYTDPENNDHGLMVTTDNKWKPFLTRFEVPEKILAEEFDYLTEDDTDGFFKYKGQYYHTSQFLYMAVNHPGLEKWSGVMSFSYSNGIMVKLSRDGERYKVGYYYNCHRDFAIMKKVA